MTIEASPLLGLPTVGGAPLAESSRRSLFIASFMTLIAAGLGFAIRGAIIGDWGAQFGFTKSDLGAINGVGLAGLGITIVFFAFFADLVGYRALLLLAFALFAISGVVTLCAGPAFNSGGKNAAFYTLYAGTFIFAIGHGCIEAAINPLTATLYPKEKTHYLNILHAGWPGGLMLGGVLNYLLHGKEAKLVSLPWQVLAVLYMVPTLYFGFQALRHKFPLSEARAAGITFAQTLGTLAAPLLLFLFLIHGMIGYVELGTDSWIQNILSNTLAGTAGLLFAYTSVLMFVLRFFAGPIVHKINPLGLLFISAVLGATGLYFLGSNSTGLLIWVAATIFAFGKSFYWPTMLGVIGERFPKGGALAMGLSGGIGMLSAGLLGGPGIGYTQDRHAQANLVAAAPATYERVKASDKNHFLAFEPVQGLDGAKVELVQNPEARAQLQSDLAKKPDDKDMQALSTWWTGTEAPHAETDKPLVTEATIFGGRRALQITSAIPVAMAACFLILVGYFVLRGGYKVIYLDASGRESEGKHTAEHEMAIEAKAPTSEA